MEVESGGVACGALRADPQGSADRGSIDSGTGRASQCSSAQCAPRAGVGPAGGVDGIYCSNHAGRHANGGLPALDCLPAVVKAADGLPVLFDSGVRSGADIIKALALGATAVGIGRPYAYGLALGGVDGVVHVLRSLLAEADLLMAVDGYPSVRDLTAEALQCIE